MSKVDKKVKGLLHKVLAILIEMNESDYIDCWYDILGHVNSLDVRVKTSIAPIASIEFSTYYAGSMGKPLFVIQNLEELIFDLRHFKAEVEFKTTPEYIAANEKAAKAREKARLLKHLEELGE